MSSTVESICTLDRPVGKIILPSFKPQTKKGINSHSQSGACPVRIDLELSSRRGRPL